MDHFRNMLALSTWPRYALWHYTQQKPFRCTLNEDVRLSIRPRPSRDYDTVYEIFHDRIYDCDLTPSGVRRIIDLGGNAGYSCLFWCVNYPNVNVLVFEPHPTHCCLLEWHVEKNGFSKRVELVAAAAGVRNGVASLTDADDSSAIIEDKQQGSLSVKVVDVFQAVPDGPIDILKMDIEGSEYSILEDVRFEALAARTERVMLEWHARGGQGEAYCRDRLIKVGFRVEGGRARSNDFGMLYGTKSNVRVVSASSGL